MAENYAHWLKTKLKIEHSMITSKFEGHFLVEIQCSNCEYETFNFETFAELNLDLANHDQNQKNITIMREKFKKGNARNRRESERAMREEDEDAQDARDRQRRGSAVFDLGDSIFQNSSELDFYNSNKILNRKSTIRKNIDLDDEGQRRKAQEPGSDMHAIEENDEKSKEDKKMKKKKEPILLTKLIESFFSEEYIEDYKCSNCKRKTIIRKIYKIIKQPEILIISLKRFEFYPKIKKIRRSVVMGTQEVDLRKYIYSNIVSQDRGLTPNQVQSNVVNDDSPAFFSGKHIFAEDSDLDQNVYQMKAYIEHHGKMNKGHYVSFIKRKIDHETEEWLLKNDDSVYSVINHANYLQEKNETVYSIFYQMEKKRI